MSDESNQPPSVAHLSPKAKVERLIKMVRGRKRALILTHDNPDPDSLASALALAWILERRARLQCHIAYGGIIGRAENLAFVRVLKLPVFPVADVQFDDYDVFALVDTQETVGNHALPEYLKADIVIDHHPPREGSPPVAFLDVGGHYGATSTLLTEYLRAARVEPSPELATALYYGIKADTRDLERETREPDVRCYMWLFPRIDRAQLAQIEHPELPVRYFQLYHAAIERAKVYSTAVMTDLGQVYTPDMVAEVAERMSFIDVVKWSLAFGGYKNQLYLSLRVSDRRMNAGRLVRDACDGLGGSAGGHGSMAGARLPYPGAGPARAALKREVVKRFKQAFGVEGERGTALLNLSDMS